jgi:conjugal transfer pilus assembly protein TraF
MRPTRTPLRGLLLAIVLAAVNAASAAELTNDATYWRRQEEGWFWYRDPPKVRTAKTPASAVPTPTPAAKLPEIVAHEDLKASLAAALAVAYMNPTDSNVRAYLALQTQAVRRASSFADAWQKVVWATPEFDFTLERPVNATALEVYDREREAAQVRTAEQLARTHVLFFLFRSDCPYCQQFAPQLKTFEQKFGLRVFAISLDGGTLPEFPLARIDNGVATALKVTQVPALFLASPRTNTITPLGYGVLSESELLERLQVIATPIGNASAAMPSLPLDLAGVR